MTRRVLAAALLASAALLLPAGSRGQNLEISPVLVDLSSSAPSAVVTVKNLGKGPMRYQVKGFTWSEDRAGKPVLTPSSDFSIFPPLFQLPPGAEKKVRVGATVKPEGFERSWRLVVEELPDAVVAQGNQVTIRTRFAIPVFLAPLKPEARCTPSLAVEGKKLMLVVANQGTIRVKPVSTSVALFDAAGKQLRSLDVAPWYVLARGERAWDVGVPAELCALVRRATVVADVAGKKLEASQDFPGGVCGG